jgi:hypothetical protein
LAPEPPPPAIVPPPLVAAPPLEAPPNDFLNVTLPPQVMSPLAAQKSTLPFQASAAPPAPSVSRSSSAHLGGLPFQGAAPITPSPAAAPAQPPPGEQDFGTMTVVGATSPLGESLPFRSGDSALLHLTVTLDAPAPRAKGMGQTMTLPVSPAGSSPDQPRPLPFKPTEGAAPPKPSALSTPSAPLRPRLSLEQFASLAAEITVAPAKAAEVRRRYSLDEASHQREAQAWNQQFSNDAELYRRFGTLFESYRDWLSRTRR